jgi:ubiquinone/menaquinone biosynthesis C-methylase UbiE
MPNRSDFNSVAHFYDWLSRLVFGQRIKKAQIEVLKFIPPNSSILIAGGGTGWILEEINKVIPSGLTITYIDKSSKMIQLSKKRKQAGNSVEFINESIEEINLQSQKYDVILTPFFLDCFSQKTFEFVFQKLNASLKQDGLWLNIDFHLSNKSKNWQKAMVKIMYAFFSLLCNIEAKKLPFINDSFSNYTLIKQKAYCNNFIVMQVFQKLKPASLK